MAYNQQLADSLLDVFESSGMHAKFEEKDDFGLFSLRVKLHCRLQSAQMLVLVRNDNFSTVTQIPLSADEDHRLAVAEYLTRVNFNMRNGNFELNMEDGEIRFKTYMCIGDGALNPKAARVMIMLPFLMLERFGDGLLEVLFGFKSPSEAFYAVQQGR